MYTQKDWQEIDAMVRRRWKLAILPAVAVIAAAVAVFVYGQLSRSEQLWKLTVALTVLGGGAFLFFFGVSVRPALAYRRHVGYMLNGRMRETTGVFKSFSDAVSDREGLACHAMFLNVGTKDDPEDDRLFYYDVYKPRPDSLLGTVVTVLSNDKMVSSIQRASEG